MTNKIKAFFFVLFFAAISILFSSQINGVLLSFSSGILKGFYSTQEYFKNSISKHFMQADEIEALRTENKELRKSAILLSTFANELDQILVDKNSSKYNPDVKLVKTLSYVNIGDYNKFWIDFPEFNKSKVYGAVFQGNTIGVVAEKDDKPLAILQNDPKVAFSVYVGADRIPGIVNGDGKNIYVRYIPQWLNPQIGDEVSTSGLDNIFFSGVPVGKVVKVIDEELYKSALVKPYSSTNVPAFLYIITKEN